MKRVALLIVLCALPAVAQLTFTNTTSARVVNTVYQNTSSHPIFVLMTANNSSTPTPADSVGQLLVDSVNPPVQQVTKDSVTQHFGGAANGNAGAVLVPVGYYYEFVFTSNTFPVAITYSSETSIDFITSAVQSTPVRALTTIYHNTGSDPLYVSVVVLTGVSAGTVQLVSDASITPTTVIADGSNDAGHYMTLSTWVMPGNYYQVTGTNITKDSWVETSAVGLSMTQADVTASRCEDALNYTICNYSAANPLFAAITSDYGNSRAAGSHFSGNGSTLGSLTDIISVTRNASQDAENLIPVPQGWDYGDRNDNGGSTLGHWIEWRILNAPTTLSGEKKRRAMN